MDTYVGTQAAIGAVLAVCLFGVAGLVHRHAPSGRFAMARTMFVAWWAALGGAWLVWAADTLVAQSGLAGQPWALLDWTLILAYFVLIVMAFASLFYYLLVLFTGRASLAWAVWLLYGALTLVLLTLFGLGSPPTSGVVQGLYADRIFGAYTGIANLLRVVLLVPPILASLGLFLVVRRAGSAAQRYRLALLGASLALYLLMPLFFGSNPGVRPLDPAGWAREAANKAALLLAIGAVVLAYRPPAWIARRLAEPPEGR